MRDCSDQYCNVLSSVSSCLMDPRGLRVTQVTYFSLLTHTKQLSLVTFCHLTAGIEKWEGTGQTDAGLTDADAAVRTDRRNG